MAKKIKELPHRSAVTAEDTWDLASLFSSDEAWESAFNDWTGMLPQYEIYRGTLSVCPQNLLNCLNFDAMFDRAGEKLGTYAFLRTAEDASDNTAQTMRARYMGVASKAAQAASFIRPEIMAISDDLMNQFLQSWELADYKVMLERLLRHKPHTLSEPEERLLAMQTEMAETSNQVFGQLNNVDLKFGTIKIDKGETVELSHATFSKILYSPKRKVRREAFHTYYEEYSDHANTLAALLNGSMQRDVYNARVRGFASAREAALFPDNMPVTVYDNLIDTVHRFLPSLHYYYDVRRRAMGLKEIHHYDTYVPILDKLQAKYDWGKAVDVVLESLKPLGSEYTAALETGLRGRWCDRYENKGKQSGAFSCGSFDGDPYILMNFQDDVLNHVFTLTHEAGHSMHSYYSAKSQPFQYYNYTIFVAEVASTFNEELLGRYLMERAQTPEERAYYLNREIDDMRGTIIRQTMFAEFEKIAHEMVENNEPLTLQAIKSVYRKLLERYFGPDFALDEELSLEALRIPHFYRAFYVYKYATGMSAAIALSQRVLGGGEAELNDYLNFLRGGCSKDPLDLLRGAGVDMETPAAIETALTRFEHLVKELDDLLSEKKK